MHVGYGLPRSGLVKFIHPPAPSEQLLSIYFRPGTLAVAIAPRMFVSACTFCSL